MRIIDAAARRLKLADGAVFANVEKYGNTSAASVPVALCEALEEGRIAAWRHGGDDRLRGRADVGHGGLEVARR